MNARVLALTAVLALFTPGSGVAEAVRAGELRVEQPWSRATAPGAPAAGYLRIVNEGQHDDRLLGARSPVAARVMLHRSVESEGMTRMQHQDRGVVIPAGDSVALEPGGYHLMLMQLEAPLREDQRVPVTLRFERAGEVEVELDVRALTEGIE